jgi:hypothetical protein
MAELTRQQRIDRLARIERIEQMSPPTIGSDKPPTVVDKALSLGDPMKKKDAPIPAAKGESPDTAIPYDLYKSNAKRFRAGFADVAGAKELLKDRFLQDIQRNSDNEIVGRGPDGKWYRDNSDFRKNPLNWMTANAGPALSNIGMIGAGMSGGPVPAIGGAMAGDYIKQKLGQKMGVRDGISYGDSASTAISAALGELTGMGANKAASRFAQSGVASRLKNIVADADSKVWGGDPATVRRMIDRPDQVLHPKPPMEIAKAGEVEFKATQKAKLDTHGALTDKFDATHGSDIQSTLPIIEQRKEAMRRMAPDEASGLGLLEPKEQRVLSKMDKRILTSKVMSHSPLDDALESKIVYSPTENVIFQDAKDAVKYSPIEMRSLPTEPVPFTPVKVSSLKQDPVSFSPLLDMEIPSGKVQPEWPRTKKVEFSPFERGFQPASKETAASSPYQQGVMATGQENTWMEAVPAVVAPKIVGHENVLPEQSNTSLRKSMQGLGAMIEKDFDPERQTMGARTAAFTRYLRGMYGDIREKLHPVDPAFSRSNEIVHELGMDSRHLTPVLNPKAQEGFIAGLRKSENSSQTLDAAKRQMPGAFEDILDMRANYGYDKPSETLVGPISKKHLAMGTGAAIGFLGDQALSGGDTQSSTRAALMMMMLTNPSLHKYGMYGASKYGIPLFSQGVAAETKSLADEFSPYTRK